MGKCEIIAEVGLLHNGSMDNAIKIIERVSQCGADVAKFQTHIPEAETLPDAPMPDYFKEEPRFQYFKRTGFSLDQWKTVRKICEENNVEFLSSVFSIEAVDLLEKVGVERYKIPSGEVTNLPLLDYVAKRNKPIILSSGMSNWEELDEAVAVILKHHDEVTVLQCTSLYPANYPEIGLNAMVEMRERYKVPVGLSDHSMTNYASFTAVALGASVIEKHFSLSRDLYGSDARHSLELEEFSELVQGVRAIDKIISNNVDKNNISKFEKMREVFQKSIVSTREISKGEPITKDMISIKKPGNGIPPKYFNELIGKKAVRDIKKDTVIKFDDVEGDIWQGKYVSQL